MLATLKLAQLDANKQEPTRMETILKNAIEGMKPPCFLLRALINVANDEECQAKLTIIGGGPHGYTFVPRGKRICAWSRAAIMRTVKDMFALPYTQYQLAYLYWYCVVRVDQDPKTKKAIVRVYAASCGSTR